MVVSLQYYNKSHVLISCLGKLLVILSVHAGSSKLKSCDISKRRICAKGGSSEKILVKSLQQLYRNQIYLWSVRTKNIVVAAQHLWQGDTSRFGLFMVVHFCIFLLYMIIILTCFEWFQAGTDVLLCHLCADAVTEQSLNGL